MTEYDFNWLCDKHLEVAEHEGRFGGMIPDLAHYSPDGIGCDVADCEKKPISYVRLDQRFWEGN